MTQDAAAQEIVKTMPPGLAALIARAGKGAGRPPVERWNPPHCGKIDMRVAADGSWHYMGSPINREPLVRLFASVMRREPDGSICLVTPVEKIEIEVDDAPFVVVELHADGVGDDQSITVRTNVGDVVTIGHEYPLLFDEEMGTEGLKPYVLVRPGLEALVARHLVFELVDLADETASSETELIVRSAGIAFSSSANRRSQS